MANTAPTRRLPEKNRDSPLGAQGEACFTGRKQIFIDLFLLKL